MLAAMSRLDSYQERPEDRGDLVDVLALAVLYSRLCSDDAPFDRKAMRLVLDLYQRVSHYYSHSVNYANLTPVSE